MIMENKGTKTFMLCTHLLSEAENLCDMISIMVKGNVYTVGSPQYLANKFGTEYKIDVMLDDESEECSLKCDTFFSTKLPIAEMSIKRPKARIYSIPANEIELHELFTIMQEGADDNTNSGFSYYTCSSSSLERVFMEIVKMSENNENQQTERDEKEKDSSEGVYESIQNSAALRNSQLSSASIGKASNIRDTVGIEDNIDDSNSYSSSSSSSSAEGVYRSNLA
ncbi:ABC transporter [Tritrichomonas foetus]|uniref:ABC transporter n=1 Tax=Tritrichomonas foetus TaxID=1144522 RepID=A0A1J4K0U7_9EUKA|nr:ABC transporter [Tritrichomonas foetus]|eukprot:OHT04578.1 ABC transporter [Tritrichomonas foetus]